MFIYVTSSKNITFVIVLRTKFVKIWFSKVILTSTVTLNISDGFVVWLFEKAFFLLFF